MFIDEEYRKSLVRESITDLPLAWRESLMNRYVIIITTYIGIIDGFTLMNFIVFCVGGSKGTTIL